MTARVSSSQRACGLPRPRRTSAQGSSCSASIFVSVFVFVVVMAGAHFPKRHRSTHFHELRKAMGALENPSISYRFTDLKSLIEVAARGAGNSDRRHEPCF